MICCRFHNKQTIANAEENVDLNINTTERKWAEVYKARPSSHVMAVNQSKEIFLYDGVSVIPALTRPTLALFRTHGPHLEMEKLSFMAVSNK